MYGHLCGLHPPRRSQTMFRDHGFENPRRSLGHLPDPLVRGTNCLQIVVPESRLAQPSRGQGGGELSTFDSPCESKEAFAGRKARWIQVPGNQRSRGYLLKW